MKILKGEIIRNDEVLKEAQMKYKDTQGFFVALVNICEQLDVAISLISIGNSSLLWCTLIPIPTTI